MIDLSDIMEILQAEILEHDVNIIINHYTNDYTSLTFTYIHMPSHSCGHSQLIYQKILEILSSKSLSSIILEIMPLIDEYLEYISVSV